MTRQLPLANSAEVVTIDDDLYESLVGASWVRAGGRIISHDHQGWRQLVDLATEVSGEGARPNPAHPLDYRRSKLIGAQAEFPETSGSFHPYYEVSSDPHIIVDSYSTANTVLGLSHWPSGQYQSWARGDTSTEIVSRYLAGGGVVPRLPVTSHHFDADGLFSAFLLLNPDLNEEDQQLLRFAAEVGDFAWPQAVEAVHLSTLVDHWCDEQSGPLARTLAGLDRAHQHAALFAAGLDALPDWLAAARQHATDVGAARSQQIVLDIAYVGERARYRREHPQGDLELIVLDPSWELDPTAWPYFGIDPIAVHSATRHYNIAIAWRGACRIIQRYEGWVRLRRPQEHLRRDLQPLANLIHRSLGCPATYDGVFQMIPTLETATEPKDESTLFELILDNFSRCPIGWNPDDGRVP